MPDLRERPSAPIPRALITAAHIGAGRTGRVIQPGRYGSLILLFATAADPEPLPRYCANAAWRPLP